MSLGHVYPSAPIFGVTPCPMTIFTFGMLLLTTKEVPIYLLVVPLLWGLIGTGAALQLEVIPDYGLLISALVATALLVFRDHVSHEPEPARLPD